MFLVIFPLSFLAILITEPDIHTTGITQQASLGLAAGKASMHRTRVTSIRVKFMYFPISLLAFCRAVEAISTFAQYELFSFRCRPITVATTFHLLVHNYP